MRDHSNQFDVFIITIYNRPPMLISYASEYCVLVTMYEAKSTNRDHLLF